MLGDFDVSFSKLGHKLNLPVEDAGTIVLHSKDCDLDCVVNVGWFSKSIFPDVNFRLNLHGTVGFDSPDRYIPADAKMNAVKEGVKNIARRIAFQKPTYLSYTYYYESFYTIMKLFFDSLKNGSEFPVSLPQQLDVIRIIESAYKINGAQKNGEGNNYLC
jgi:predicted dehydrogenase